jgi:hypothetical protein
LGQVDTLQKLRFHGAAFTADVFAAAAMAGSIDCLQLLWDWNCIMSAGACAAAAGTARLEVVQWLRARSPPCPWDEEVCARAASSGRLPVLQWAAAAGCPCGSKTLNAAIFSRRVNAIRWLCVERGIGSREQRARILTEALQDCDVAMLKLAHDLQLPLDKDALYAALTRGRQPGLRSLRAAAAAGYDLLKAGVLDLACSRADAALLRLAHAWGVQPDPAVAREAPGRGV